MGIGIVVVILVLSWILVMSVWNLIFSRSEIFIKCFFC